MKPALADEGHEGRGQTHFYEQAVLVKDRPSMSLSGTAAGAD